MNVEEFIDIQDNILRMKGKELADLLGAEPSSISGYRNGVRAIPEYIAKALRLHAEIKGGQLELPLTLNELFALNNAAAAKGLSLEAYIVRILRAGLPSATPVNPVRPLYVPADIASSRLNEDPADPDAPRKQPA